MVGRKLKARAGESVAETLVAVLIMALAFLILTGAVLAAARVNERVKNEDVAFAKSDGDPAAPTVTSVSVSLDGGSAEPYNVNLYEKNGYYYYEKPAS